MARLKKTEETPAPQLQHQHSGSASLQIDVDEFTRTRNAVSEVPTLDVSTYAMEPCSAACTIT